MQIEVPEIQSVDHILQILNTNDQLLNEAHNPDSKKSFEPELASLWVFRETMLERTQEYLDKYVEYTPAIDGIRRRLEDAVNVSLGLCFSRSNPYTIESNRLTEEDAYKARYLLEYLYFLKEFNTLITQYTEYALGYAMSQTPPANYESEAAAHRGNAHRDSQVKGIPVNLPEAEDVNMDKKEYKKTLNSDEKKAYRLVIIVLIITEKGGWEKFLEPLTNDGKAQLYAEIADASKRYFTGFLNKEKSYPWDIYAPWGRDFLDNLPRFKR